MNLKRILLALAIATFLLAMTTQVFATSVNAPLANPAFVVPAWQTCTGCQGVEGTLFPCQHPCQFDQFMLFLRP